MWNEPTKERLSKLPRLYETENVPLKEKLVHLHFFIGGCDWYICETDGKDLMWGFCILNNDYDMAEWGYVSLSELREIKVSGWLEVDCEREEFWQVKKAKEIKKIRLAQGWSRGENIPDLALDLIPDSAQNPEHTSSMREDRP
ncbi:MAG: DUF2958 domain-containing protein [Deltaproteobacteria bacterium]|nr:DUF2958 domain-containing protein [Deltaproteobacteria bacterium]